MGYSQKCSIEIEINIFLLIIYWSYLFNRRKEKRPSRKRKTQTAHAHSRVLIPTAVVAQTTTAACPAKTHRYHNVSRSTHRHNDPTVATGWPGRDIYHRECIILFGRTSRGTIYASYTPIINSITTSGYFVMVLIDPMIDPMTLYLIHHRHILIKIPRVHYIWWIGHMYPVLVPVCNTRRAMNRCIISTDNSRSIYRIYRREKVFITAARSERKSVHYWSNMWEENCTLPQQSMRGKVFITVRETVLMTAARSECSLIWQSVREVFITAARCDRRKAYFVPTAPSLLYYLCVLCYDLSYFYDMCLIIYSVAPSPQWLDRPRLCYYDASCQRWIINSYFAFLFLFAILLG